MIYPLPDLKVLLTNQFGYPEFPAIPFFFHNGLMDFAHYWFASQRTVKLNNATASVKNKLDTQYRSDFISFGATLEPREYTLPDMNLREPDGRPVGFQVQADGAAEAGVLQFFADRGVPVSGIRQSGLVANLYPHPRTSPLASEPSSAEEAMYLGFAIKYAEMQYSDALGYVDANERNRFIASFGNFLLRAISSHFNVSLTYI